MKAGGCGNNEHLLFERKLFQYSQALERGDFEAVAAVLKQAESDPQLEKAILEMNAAQAEVFGLGAEGSDPTPIPNTGTVVLSERPLPLKSSRLVRLLDHVWAVLSGWRYLPQTGAVLAGVLLVSLAALLFDQGYSSGQAPENLLPAQQAEQVLQWDLLEGPSNATDLTSTPRLPSAWAGRLTLSTSDVYQARRQVEGMVSEMVGQGAAIQSTQEDRWPGSDLLAVRMVVRVPVDRYEETMERLAGLSEQVLARSDTSHDIAGILADLDVRIAQLAVSRQRLQEIIKSAPTTLDRLNAEKELTRREADLDVLRARRAVLAENAGLAEIQVQFQPILVRPPSLPARWDPQETAESAMKHLVASARRFVQELIWFSIATLPWVISAALLFFVLFSLLQRWAIHRHRKE